jgi:Ca-activated chloride channel family protein
MGFIGPAALTLVAAAVLLAYQQEDPTFRVDVKLVRLLATVKDNYGRTIGGLAKEDFIVTDNGARQDIALFERHTEQPLSVAILLDTSGSTAKDMRYQTDAVTRFIHAFLGEGNPEDRAALFTFNWEVRQQTAYTRNAAALSEKLKRLKGEAGTSLYDAIYLAAESVAEREGRHVLVVVTDGGDTVSTTGFQRAMEIVHTADAVMYPILTVPITNEAGRNVGGENALTIMAQSTGGRMFVPGLNGLDQVFSDILRDLRTQYLIGFYPRRVPLTKDRFHRLSITTQRPDLRVVSRTGYYGDAESSPGSSRK